MRIHLIQLKNVPIYEQLKLEEALLRTDHRSFCIVNFGSPKAIVMGISGKPEELLEIEKVKKDKVPVIKRFSGGGTVVVDEQTLFVTFIFAKNDLEISPFPEPILQWTSALYANAWQIPGFQLKENDFCIGNLKCGGNAQYIKKDRWLHHTSFLWDYEEQNMSYLKVPKKQPKYRENRGHEAFLTKLKAHGEMQQLVGQLMANVKPLYIDCPVMTNAHRKSTHIIEL